MIYFHVVTGHQNPFRPFILPFSNSARNIKKCHIKNGLTGGIKGRLHAVM
jgi:hypothetical protein